jgi:hypothetical protein
MYKNLLAIAFIFVYFTCVSLLPGKDFPKEELPDFHSVKQGKTGWADNETIRKEPAASLYEKFCVPPPGYGEVPFYWLNGDKLTKERLRWQRGMLYGCDQMGRGLNPMEYGDYFRAIRWYSAPGHDTPGADADIILVVDFTSLRLSTRLARRLSLCRLGNDPRKPDPDNKRKLRRRLQFALSARSLLHDLRRFLGMGSAVLPFSNALLAPRRRLVTLF